MAWIRERKKNYRDIFERGFRVTELPTAVWSWRFERDRQKASSLYTLRLRVYIDERKLTTNTQSTNFSCGVLETGLIPTLSHLRLCVGNIDDFWIFSLCLLQFFFCLYRRLVSFLGIEITFVSIFLLPTYATSVVKYGSRDAWRQLHNDVISWYLIRII